MVPLLKSISMASAPKRGRAPEPSRQAQAIGKSRGGLTAKRLALTDGQGRLVRFLIRPGNVAAAKELPALLAGTLARTPGTLGR